MLKTKTTWGQKNFNHYCYCRW